MFKNDQDSDFPNIFELKKADRIRFIQEKEDYRQSTKP